MHPRVDLHVHSSCSDGVHPPPLLAARAAAAGVRALALCDHDNIDGVVAAQDASRDLGIHLVSGVELSCVWRNYQDIHLLGYGFDPADAVLGQALRDFQQFRAQRNGRIVEKVNAVLRQRALPPLDFAAVSARAAGSIGRPHIAMELMAQGLVGSMEEAFQQYLVSCNEPKRFFPVDEAIGLIRAAGGVAVLAHPPYITRDPQAMQQLLDELCACGLQGIEAYNNGVNCDELEWYLAQARRRDLLVTGGSDFHGIEDGGAEFGRIRAIGDIPYSCYERLQLFLQTHQHLQE